MVSKDITSYDTKMRTHFNMSFLCFCSFKLKVYLQNHIKVSYFAKHLFGKCYSDRKV